MRKDSLADIGLSLDLDLKSSDTELTIAIQMDLGIEIFRCTSVLERGELKSKAGGKTSIHFNDTTQNIELLLQMIISVNQLSLFGAVADMIEELAVGQSARDKSAASGQLDKLEIILQHPLAET